MYRIEKGKDVKTISSLSIYIYLVRQIVKGKGRATYRG